MARRFVPLDQDNVPYPNLPNREEKDWNQGVVIQKRNLITDRCCDDLRCSKTAQRIRIMNTQLSPAQRAEEARIGQQSKFSPKTVVELEFGPRSKVALKIARAGLIENGVRTDRCLAVLQSRVNETEFKRFVVRLLK